MLSSQPWGSCIPPFHDHCTSHPTPSPSCGEIKVQLRMSHVSSSVTWRKRKFIYALQELLGLQVPCCVVPFNRYLGDWKPPWAPGLWMWGCSCLFVEGFIHLVFLVRWPLADLHWNVSCHCSPFNPDPQCLCSSLSVPGCVCVGWLHGLIHCKKYHSHFPWRFTELWSASECW